jgi:membrane protein YdbS with pleckstrin-like domain
MDNNIDFKDLWKKQSVSEPNFEDLLVRLKQFKKTAICSLLITNVLLIATSVFIAAVWYYYQPQFISTKIGIIITILTMIMYLVIYNRLLKSYKNIDSTQTNQEYLQNLISIKKKQQYLQSTILSLYFILLTIGLCLYMYEYAGRMTLFWGIFTYAMTLFWMAINWFFIRPKQIKKQQNKINNLIEKFEDVSNQLH